MTEMRDPNAVGIDFAELDWTDRAGEYVVGAGINTGECMGRRLPDALAARTPEPFRDLLLGLARSVCPAAVAA